MIEFIQETSLPKLSQTSLYEKFNETSDISNHVKDEIKRSKNFIVKPSDIADVVAIMRLNGDAILKKALEAYTKGDMILINNTEKSEIPPCLPYIVITREGHSQVFVFVHTVVDVITSPQEIPKLMAVMEAAYLALSLTRKPSAFLMNSLVMLTLCKIYVIMASMPLQQKMYIKGDNLNKSMIYLTGYFYKMFRDVNDFDATNISLNKILDDKIDTKVAQMIIDDVKTIDDNAFMSLIHKIQKLNPVRYKDLDSMYMSYFTNTCGSSLIFALENISYLFLLLTSSAYKTTLTGYGLNKVVCNSAKKLLSAISGTV